MAIVKSIAVAFLAAQAASAATIRAQHRQLSFVEIAGYEPNSQVTDHVSFYLQHSNERRSQHLDTNSANDMSGVEQAGMCYMRLLFSDIKLHWHCFDHQLNQSNCNCCRSIIRFI